MKEGFQEELLEIAKTRELTLSIEVENDDDAARMRACEQKLPEVFTETHRHLLIQNSPWCFVVRLPRLLHWLVVGREEELTAEEPAKDGQSSIEVAETIKENLLKISERAADKLVLDIYERDVYSVCAEVLIGQWQDLIIEAFQWDGMKKEELEVEPLVSKEVLDRILGPPEEEKIKEGDRKAQNDYYKALHGDDEGDDTEGPEEEEE